MVLGRYRLLALEQAARAARGTPASIPGDDLLWRDLYLLAEAVAVDALLVRMFPLLQRALREARLEANERRPVVPRASRQELAVETLVYGMLRAHPATPPAPFIVSETSGVSRRWAKDQRTTLMELAGPYRGMAPVELWGAPAAAPEWPATAGPLGSDGPPPSGRSRTLPRRPRVRPADESEDDAEPGTWMVRADDPQEKAEDPAGLQRPADRDEQADPGELADALSELPELRLVRSPGAVHEILAGEDPILESPASAVCPRGSASPIPSGTGELVPIGAAVRLCESAWRRRETARGWMRPSTVTPR